MEQKINGDIELLRFVFAVGVMLYHFRTNYNVDLFVSGAIGVEFFFIVSGMLLAKSVENINLNRDEIPYNTWKFIIKKVSKFYPYMIMAGMIQLLFSLLTGEGWRQIIRDMLTGIPNYLLLDMSGITSRGLFALGGSWYLSAMIISLLILYPIITYNYEWATGIIFPILGTLGMGIIYINYGGLFENHAVFNYVIKVGLLRGVCEIALGAWGYTVSMSIKHILFTKVSILVLTIAKYFCFIVVITYAVCSSDAALSVVVWVICLVGIVLSFSQRTKIIQPNSVIKYLGKISLPIYILHPVSYKVLTYFLGVDNSIKQFAFISCSSIAASILTMIIIECVIKTIKRFKYIFILSEEQLARTDLLCRKEEK